MSAEGSKRMARKDDRLQQAVQRYHVIRPHFEEGVCQTEIARVSGIPLKTVQRWIRSYREAGADKSFDGH